MEAVKGLQGYWHFAFGQDSPNGWFDGNRMRTLCGKGISPNYLRVNQSGVKRVVDCPKCQAKYKAVAEEAKKKYMELNNLTQDTCNPQDRENIRFNIDHALGVRA